ncbi:outer membrane protein transport protein [Photobacterium swingsii]|uniref:outer membrane protein transport protein n=1 Tax=Photobacterium swingsii TaxID=680026 RepID=UPI004068F836
MSIKINRTAIAVTIALTSLHAHSAGFQVSEHSASGLGRAFAGEAAIADNASVIARNPAAMTMFDSIAVSGSMSYIDPQIDITAKAKGINQKVSDVAPTAIVPAGYFIQPINDQLAWGLALTSNYGFATDYPKDFHFGTDAGKTSLLTINLNPNIAYRINEQFSIGGGVSVVYADAELNRHYGGLNPSNPSKDLIELKGDTWEWGWNLGALYEVNGDNRFALSYRSQVDLNFEGDFTDYTGGIISDPTAGKTVKGKLTVVTPASAEFAGFHQLNKEFAVHYSVQWTQWSKFKELRATSDQCKDGICLLKEEQFEDSFRYSIGATYTINPEWKVRSGFAFDEQAGKATLSIPDTDRYWYSAGMTYTHSRQLSFDLGFTYLYGKSSEFKESGSTFSAENDAFLTAAQMNYRF